MILGHGLEPEGGGNVTRMGPKTDVRAWDRQKQDDWKSWASGHCSCWRWGVKKRGAKLQKKMVEMTSFIKRYFMDHLDLRGNVGASASKPGEENAWVREWRAVYGRSGHTYRLLRRRMRSRDSHDGQWLGEDKARMGTSGVIFTGKTWAYDLHVKQ